MSVNFKCIPKWDGDITNYEDKLKVAKKVASFVKDGEIIGFGSGTTSYLTVIEIGKRVKQENLKIKAVPTANIIKELCDYFGIEVISLDSVELDWCFDGADEVDKNNWMIKGKGAAMYKEKLNILASPKTYILIDNSKFVDRLGSKNPVPVECRKDKIESVRNALYDLGAVKIYDRLDKNCNLFVTENDNYILDAWFDKIEKDYEEKIRNIDGVVESGLFIGYNIEIIN